MNLEKIYSQLPIWMQTLALNAEGYNIKKKRYSSEFFNIFNETNKRSFFSSDQFFEIRDNRLREFIKHCFKTVPYYKKKVDINPESIKTIADLSLNIPILSKQEIQDNIDDFVSENIPKNQMISIHTSGTTGGGLKFFATKKAIHEQWAVWWRYRLWHGINFNIQHAYFGGRSIVPIKQTVPPFWRYNYFGNQILFSGYHMSSDTIKFYVEELKRRRPIWLHGYPSLLALLSNYIVENNIDLEYQIKWITIGAENLLLKQVDIIKKAFGIKPIQHYGMAEGVANFSECEKGVLHVDEDYSAVEFIPNNDGTYKIIGTNFTNWASPFLRYEVGDIATLKESKCSCGRPGRLVENVDGRKEDYIKLPNGALLGRLDHIFKDMINIREAQIYQKNVNEIIVKIAKNSKYSSNDEQMLLKEFRKRVGDNIIIKFDYVNELIRSKTGKLRFVISDLKE